MIEMVHDSYGKSDVRLMKVTRDADAHRVVECRVDIELQGDLSAGYTEGDNAKVLPTDTMKNTVYALARKHSVETAEQFALRLAHHFVGTQASIEHARIAVSARPWEAMELADGPRPHAFTQARGERHTAVVTHDGDRTDIESGLRDLVILKSANSGFSNFVEDEFTTLEATDDRVLATSLEATWQYEGSNLDFASLHDQIRQHLLATFADHHSRSVQHTLYAMGKAVLNEVSEVVEIHISMPNKHNLPVDLEPFDLDNPHQILMPIDEPSGQIEATLARTSDN